MAYKPKTWTQKWAEAKAKPERPKVLDCPEMGERFVVPGPAEIEAIVRAVPKGRILSMPELTGQIAKKHGVATCCPMTTGIFVWIMAHAAEESGKGDIPWWRVVKKGGELNPKYPGAPDLQKGLLESEGHRVEVRGKRVILLEPLPT
jgi:alkylated DNA nucleotide flippase Atl1